jgi:hypothetical protein
VLFSPACERNKGPILAVLQQWLPASARVLEIGSGSGQHASFFCGQIAGLVWQASEKKDALAGLQAQLTAVPPASLAPGSELLDAIAPDVMAAERECDLPRLGEGRAELPDPAAGGIISREIIREHGRRVRPGVGLPPWAGRLRVGAIDEHPPELLEPPAATGGVGSEIDEHPAAKPWRGRAVEVRSVHAWSIKHSKSEDVVDESSDYVDRRRLDPGRGRGADARSVVGRQQRRGRRI